MKIFRPGGRCNIAGTRVRTARERAGLSQEQLAEKIQLSGLDITQKQVSRIETGDRVVADYELKYLADAIGSPSTTCSGSMNKGSGATALLFLYLTL